MLVNLIALATHTTTERLLESPIGLNYMKFRILNRYIAGYLVEQQMVTPLAPAQLTLQVLDLGDIGGHLNHRCDLAVLVADGSGLDQHRDFLPVQTGHLLFAAVAVPVTKNLLHRTNLALFRTALIDLITEPTLEIAEILSKPLIGVDDSKVPILHRQIARHGIEIETI
jgi:hypothetical protein